MKYYLEAIKEWFDEPSISKRLENKDYSIFEGWDSQISTFDIIPFILYELKFPLLLYVKKTSCSWFAGNDDIRSITFPPNVKGIGQIAACANLQEIIFEGIYDLDDFLVTKDTLFHSCQNLKKIVFTKHQNFTPNEFYEKIVWHDGISGVKSENLTVDGIIIP